MTQSPAGLSFSRGHLASAPFGGLRECSWEAVLGPEIRRRVTQPEPARRPQARAAAGRAEVGPLQTWPLVCGAGAALVTGGAGPS